MLISCSLRMNMDDTALIVGQGAQLAYEGSGSPQLAYRFARFAQ
jgi:hypothetical protein